MAVHVYINFHGNCREALDFYQQVFKTEAPEVMTFGDAPPDSGFPTNEENKDLVMHTALDIYGTTIMFSDILPEETLVEGNNISMVIMLKELAEIRELFDKLKDGGSVEMELHEAFFSKLYGSVKDRFGIIWQIMHDDM
jgi:PhnB protein